MTTTTIFSSRSISSPLSLLLVKNFVLSRGFVSTVFALIIGMLGMETMVEIVGLVEIVDTILIEKIPCVIKTDGGSDNYLVDEVLVTSVSEVLS